MIVFIINLYMSFPTAGCLYSIRISNDDDAVQHSDVGVACWRKKRGGALGNQVTHINIWCRNVNLIQKTGGEKKRLLLCPGCRGHQCFILPRNLCCLCNVTANGESLPPIFLLSSQPARGDGLVWLGDDCISAVCTVCLRHQRVLDSFPISPPTQKHAHNSSTYYEHAIFLYWPPCLLTEGRLDVTKDGLKLLTIEPEDVFAELALLYNYTHTYSVSGIKITVLASWFDICMQTSVGFFVVEV